MGTSLNNPGVSLNNGLSLNNEEMYPTSAELRRMGSSSGSHSSKSRKSSPSLSPATKAEIARINALGRSPKSSRSSRSRRSNSLSPATKAEIARINGMHTPSSSVSTPESVSGSTPNSVSSNLSPTTLAEIAQMNQSNGSKSSKSISSKRSRNGSLSPATKQALAIMNGKINAPYTIKNAPNASPATKERIAQIALNEAANVSLNTMNQIARLERGQGVGRANSPRARSRTGAESPVSDLRRTRRFRPSSIVGRDIARPFARIFGKF
jgi:hypothetical protein